MTTSSKSIRTSDGREEEVDTIPSYPNSAISGRLPAATERKRLSATTT